MMVFSGKAQKQAGLSLVELMVALLISTILLLGVLELFGSSSQTERSANALARLQENGRLVMDLIGREARRSGFYGCDSAGLSSTEEWVFGDNVKLPAGQFPAQSLKGSTDNSLTFRYFAPKDGAAISSENCKISQLKPYYVTFGNCNGGKGICINTKDSGSQTLLNNGSIKSIRYINLCKDDIAKTCSYKVEDLPRIIEGSADASFAAVTKLQVTLELCEYEKNVQGNTNCDDKAAIKRTFSSLIELRNRQQWQQ